MRGLLKAALLAAPLASAFVVPPIDDDRFEDIDDDFMKDAQFDGPNFELDAFATDLSQVRSSSLALLVAVPSVEEPEMELDVDAKTVHITPATVFKIDVLPSEEACGFGSVTINDQNLPQQLHDGKTSGKGSISDNQDEDRIFDASWTFECLKENGEDVAQRLTFDIEVVEGSAVPEDVGFTLEFSQQGPSPYIRKFKTWNGEEMDFLNVELPEHEHEHHHSRPPFPGNPEFNGPEHQCPDHARPEFDDHKFIEHEMQEIRCLKDQIDHLMHILHEKEHRVSHPQFAFHREVYDCDSIKCVVKSLYFKAKGAATHALGQITGGRFDMFDDSHGFHEPPFDKPPFGRPQNVTHPPFTGNHTHHHPSFCHMFGPHGFGHFGQGPKHHKDSHPHHKHHDKDGKPGKWENPGFGGEEFDDFHRSQKGEEHHTDKMKDKQGKPHHELNADFKDLKEHPELKHSSPPKFDNEHVDFNGDRPMPFDDEMEKHPHSNPGQFDHPSPPDGHMPPPNPNSPFDHPPPPPPHGVSPGHRPHSGGHHPGLGGPNEQIQGTIRFAKFSVCAILFCAFAFALHRRFSDPMRCAARRADREERRRRRVYRRAARKTGICAIFRFLRGDDDDYSADFEEKRTLITSQVTPEEDAMTSEIRELRNAAGVVGDIVAAEEGRVAQPASPEHLPVYRNQEQLPVSIPVSVPVSMPEELPAYDLHDVPDDSSIVTDGFCYTPGSSDYTPSGSDSGSVNNILGDTKN